MSNSILVTTVPIGGLKPIETDIRVYYNLC